MLIVTMQSSRFVAKKGRTAGLWRWSWPLARVHRRVGSEQHQTRPRQSSEGCKADRVGGRNVGVLASAYLGLVAQSVGAIDPDVLCETFAFLVEFHVFRELLTVLSVCDERSVGNFFPAGYSHW
jgi:hypothetical protein